MGIIRDSFIIFKNWAEAIETLPEEFQLETYRALVKYGINGVIPEGISLIAKAMLVSFSRDMENNFAKYAASVENGKKGGNPNFKKGQKNPYYCQEKDNPEITEDNQNTIEDNQDITQDNLEITEDNLDEPRHNLNVNVNVNDNVNVIKKRNIKEKKETFFPPTLEEIKDYAFSRNSSVDCQKFYDYFTAGNWVDSKGNKVKNWKQKFITWESKQDNSKTQPKSMLERAAESLGVQL